MFQKKLLTFREKALNFPISFVCSFVSRLFACCGTCRPTDFEMVGGFV